MYRTDELIAREAVKMDNGADAPKEFTALQCGCSPTSSRYPRRRASVDAHHHRRDDRDRPGVLRRVSLLLVAVGMYLSSARRSPSSSAAWCDW
ncbi:MAG: hypothetical protein U0792_21980 [Gemmataceae bacterium]